MTTTLEKKIIAERTVDTKTYRYIFDELNNEIRRLPIADLDTTAAINGWETVKTYNK